MKFVVTIERYDDPNGHLRTMLGRNVLELSDECDLAKVGPPELKDNGRLVPQDPDIVRALDAADHALRG